MGCAHCHVGWRFSRVTSGVDDGNVGDHWWPQPPKSHLGSSFSSQSATCQLLHDLPCKSNEYSLCCKKGPGIYWLLNPWPKSHKLKINKWKKYKFLTTDSFRQTQKKSSFSCNLWEQLKVSSLKGLQHSHSLFCNLLKCRPIKKKTKSLLVPGYQPDTSS